MFVLIVTEDEIQRGIINAKNPSTQCWWFQRKITDLKENLDDKVARNFIDKLGAQLDEEAVGFTEQLKETKIPGKLPQENISMYEIKWEAEHGVNPDSSSEHRQYIDQLCDDFLRTLKQMIDDGVKQR